MRTGGVLQPYGALIDEWNSAMDYGRPARRRVKPVIGLDPNGIWHESAQSDGFHRGMGSVRPSFLSKIIPYLIH
jgi:hypothetical protein